MKVSELIKQLSKYPQDMNVFNYDNDTSMGDSVVDVELSIKPVFIDNYGYVCVAHREELEEIEERQGDKEIHNVVMIYHRKIDNNDLTKESA